MSESRMHKFPKWLVFLLLCGARELPAGFVCQAGAPEPARVFVPPGGGVITSQTNSITCSEQVQTTNLTQRVDKFATELRAGLQGGPLLLDRTFAAAFNDPVVQSALVSAQQLLTTQGAKGLIGPALLSNTTTLTNTSTLTSFIQTAAPQVFVQTLSTIGPGVVPTDVRGQCQGVDLASGVPFGCDSNAGSPFIFPAGSINLNTNAHTLYSVSATSTTTNTFLTSQVYELDGTSGPATVPEPGTFAAMAITIAGLCCFRTRIHRRRITNV